MTSILLVLQLLLLLQVSDPGPGVSHALAIRRAATISDVRYELSLDIRARDSATGDVTVRFRSAGTEDAILDFRGRRLTSLAANGRPLSPGAADGAHIRIPAGMLVNGDNAIHAVFVTDIAPSGASIIRFHDQVDSSDYLY